MCVFIKMLVLRDYVRFVILSLICGDVPHQIVIYGLPAKPFDDRKYIYESLAKTTESYDYRKSTSLITKPQRRSELGSIRQLHGISEHFMNLSAGHAHQYKSYLSHDSSYSKTDTHILDLNLQRTHTPLSSHITNIISCKSCGEDKRGLSLSKGDSLQETSTSQNKDIISDVFQNSERNYATLVPTLTSKEQDNLFWKAVLGLEAIDRLKTINKIKTTAHNDADVSNIKGKCETKYYTNEDTHDERKVHIRSKNDIHSSPTLSMTFESENFTIFYQGKSEGGPYFLNDNISIKDAAHSKMQTVFLMKSVDGTADAYMGTINDFTDKTTLHCFARGFSEKLIYSGWHIWNDETSGIESLSCETMANPNIVKTPILTNYQLRLYPTLVQGDKNAAQTLSLESSKSGLYICIAVDSSYNVFLSNSYDIRILNVTSSTSDNIIPKPVAVNRNETQSSFLDKYCMGSLYNEQSKIKHSAQYTDLYYFYMNKSMFVNESLSVKCMHAQKWIQTEPLFENVNLSLPIIFICKLTIQVNSNTEIKILEMYFRHDVVKNETRSHFTAVKNETIRFRCNGDTISSSTAARISYLEGTCSENISLYSSDGKASIQLTINAPVCVMCSSSSSQIKLQINVEYDLRKLTSKRYQDDNSCPEVEYTELLSVRYSNACVENAIALSRKQQQMQSKVSTITADTYRSYYTSRQFIVCRNQPIPWSNVILSHSVDDSEENAIVVKVILCVTGLMLAIMICLVWKKKCWRFKIIQSLRRNKTFISLTRKSRIKSLTCDEDIFCGMNSVHPRENIDRSRICIADMISSGQYSHVYKAYLNKESECEDTVEVAVKEHMRPISKCDKNMFITRFNQEIQVLRVILPHINVIRYYGFSNSLDSNLVVMELVSGVSLLKYLRNQKDRFPNYVVKSRSRFRPNSRSDVTDLTCISYSCSSVDGTVTSLVDCGGRNIRNKSNLQETKSTTRKKEFYTNKGVIQNRDDRSINQRRDSEQYNNSLSELSELNGNWSTSFEENLCRYEENSVRRCESYLDNYSCELTNQDSKDNLVIEISSICRQVARGMAHLSSLNIIHCDVAAHNVIAQLPTGPLVVKICDFASAHRLPEGETKLKVHRTSSLSLNWMAPESLNKGEFSVYSDVWAYGVLCWEVFTLGSIPYVSAGQVDALSCPSNCDKEIYKVAESCWKTKPNERPSFEILAEMWSDILEMNSDYLELWAEPDDQSQFTSNEGSF